MDQSRNDALNCQSEAIVLGDLQSRLDDGPDHYRPDSPDDFRVACRDVSMPLPEERSSEASSS